MGRSGDGVSRRLRLGMVGGGEGAFIGGVHRIAARLDDRYELVAGALSSYPVRAKLSAAELRIRPDRAYASFREMAAAEAGRADGIDVVAIVTPNHLHHAASRAFLDAGINVICDKPMTTTLEDAIDLARAVRDRGLVFALTHNYTGYPMVRQARAMVQAGDIGDVRIIQVEYAQDWLTTKLEATGHRQAEWRADPARAGVGGCVGDIGTHAFNLAGFVSGLEPDSLCADISSFVEGRTLDDNAHILLRYANGARGMLWSSQVAPGNENALRLRIYGDKGGLDWSQEDPNRLRFTPLGEVPRLLTRGGIGVGKAAGRVTRIPPGHPEGFLEGFANIYSDVAEAITARLESRAPDPMSTFPTVEDGVRGVNFIAATVASSAAGGVWVDARVPL